MKNKPYPKLARQLYAGIATVETYTRTIPKIGRNEPCPCGSGKKYKRCHGHWSDEK